jgi:transposase
MKYIITLDREQEKVLNKLIQSAPKHRIRQRAHAIVLSSKKFSIEALSEIFNVHRDTISRWLDTWAEKGFEGLIDAPKPGRPKLHQTELQSRMN